jgi:hypothetical protein
MDDLTLRHHQEQLLIARNVIAEMAPVWGILSPADLQGTTGDWLKAVRPIIERGYLTSQYVAAEYARNSRSRTFPHATPLDIGDIPNPYGAFGTPVIPDRDTQLRIMVSMKVTGPVHVQKLMPMDETEAMAKGFSKSCGAATRLVLSGGRNILVLIAGADQLASGVQRVVSDTACEGCKARTGPVPKVAGQDAMAMAVACHDFGTCSGKIVYPPAISQ